MSPPFSEGDRAVIREIADSVATRIAGELKDHLNDCIENLRESRAAAIALHAAECPAAKRVDSLAAEGAGAWKVMVIVATVVASLLSTGAALLAKWLAP